MNVTPTTLGNRVEVLDLLRGFALLGVFIANMIHFQSPYLYMDPYTWFSSPSDAATFKVIDIFVEGSFYPIFAMLFGYGLNMQYEKTLANGSAFAPMMARRLAILLGFGLIHALLIWSGDVLFTYAAMGFIMIAVVKIPKKWILPIAAILYIIPNAIFYAGTSYLEKASPNSVLSGYADIQQIELAISAYGLGSYGEIFSFRFVEWLPFGFLGVFLAVVMILPLLMIGAGLSKWKVFERAGEMKGRIVVITVMALAAGLWLKAVPFTGEPTLAAQMLQSVFGGPILAAGYVGLLLLLSQIPLFRTVFRPVSKAGRMSLTTYITQSIVATTIFYSYGFGMYGKIDLETGVWIALGVFIIQVIFAELWFMKFSMGPLEWLWRKATYGKKLTNKEGKGHRLS
ncbi:DUF418 domain-containing protein [Sporosarcina sp. YIM B06819]|uniref:DUF418 domain-containing protein n=1 Tax=Sporosarcina sp. YIM B06819 TaxID=3081769 RepID=UPI00298CD604|nr:DUF418 domain-containing protein [Sporosarcina sp. YIM B06819]